MASIKIAKVLNKLAKNGTTKLCSIKTIGKDGSEFLIGGFGNTTTESWKDGQTVELEVYQEEYNGKIGWKFKEPAERNVFTELDEIKALLKALQSSVTKITPETTKVAVSNPKTPQAQDLPPKTTPEMSVEEIEQTFNPNETKIHGEDPGEQVSDMPDWMK